MIKLRCELSEGEYVTTDWAEIVENLLARLVWGARERAQSLRRRVVSLQPESKLPLNAIFCHTKSIINLAEILPMHPVWNTP